MYVSSMLFSFVVFTWYILCNYIHTYILHVNVFNIWIVCWYSKCLAPARRDKKVVFVLISSNTILQPSNVVQPILVLLASCKEFTECENTKEFWPDLVNPLNVKMQGNSDLTLWRMPWMFDVWRKSSYLRFFMCTCLDIHINQAHGCCFFPNQVVDMEIHTEM